MSRSEILEQGDGSHPVNLRRALRLVQRRHGRHRVSQIAEMAKLALGKGKISPSEYYAYSLYDDIRFSSAEKKRFVGRAAQIALNYLCNDPQWHAIAHDKVVFAAMMQAHGLPVAKILALYHGNRTLGCVPALHTPEQLKQFLRNAGIYPFFSKPVAGMFSAGAARVEEFDPRSTELILASTGRVSLDRYVQEVVRFSDRYDGYLLQELLHPHEQIGEVCGDRIASVRLMVLLHDSGPEIIRAVWKIPTGDNIADNFARSGNLLASVDIESGRVIRVVQSKGADEVVLEQHPDTGKTAKGLTLPDWAGAKKLCLEAAVTLPGLRIQAWDIALCKDGPILQEVNIGGGYRLPQIADGVGLLDARFREFLDKQLPSWPRRTTWLVLKRSASSRFAGALSRHRRTAGPEPA